MQKLKSLLFCILFLLSFCSEPLRQPDQVKVRLAMEPETLSPVNYSDAGAIQILNLLFQSLLGADLATDQIKPILAVDLPKITKTDTASFFTYEIRPEAQWPNGSPVTTQDVAFTLKVLKAPLLNNERLKPQTEFIRGIKQDPENSRRFTFVCDPYSPEMDLLTGDFFILPAYLYDPNNFIQGISVEELHQNPSKFESNSSLIQFAEQFNSPAYSSSTKILQGSGGYLIENWVPGQQLILKKKQDWWGDDVEAAHINAVPNKIIFHVIPDNTTALLALKNKQLDVLEKIEAAEFNQLQKDEAFKQEYALHTPPSYEFAYVGINSRKPKFADKETRQAIAHLLDIKNIIAVSQQNYASQTIGPVPPSLQGYYNASLKPYTYSIDKATQLLKKAGWQKEGEGWYKLINGKKTALQIELNYRAGNTALENAALIFQQSAAKANIPVTVQPLEASLFSQKSKAHEFDMFLRTLSGNPFVLNFKPLLHTTYASLGGLNYTGFGNAESDALLDKINEASTRAEKAKYMKELQRILLDEATFISMYYQKERLAVHNRFTNTNISGLSPNYDVSSFTLKK